MPKVNRIGQWVQRFYSMGDYKNTRAHLVESEVADRFVTRCGREMKNQTNAKSPNVLLFYYVRPTDSCSRCIIGAV